MSEGNSSSWPDDEDPFSTVDDVIEEIEETPVSVDTEKIITPVEHNEVESKAIIENIPWSLPIRSAPIMDQTGDIVEEFPLNESPDGLNSTSIVVNEKLIRIVEANYGEDGQRRLNVKTVMKQGLTGFSHTHNELMHKHQWLWIAAFFVGLGFSFITQLSMFGQLLLGVGLIGWVYMHLEVHNLEFSTNGSKHKVTFTGYKSNRPMFRASMALIGPTMAKYIETGVFDTESINNLHQSLAIPAEAKPIPAPIAPIQNIPAITIAANQPTTQETIPQLPPPSPPSVIEAPQNIANDLPPPAPPKSPLIDSQANQLPPPPAPAEVISQNGPPTSNPIPPPPHLAPINSALPPATLPPPLPPPVAALPLPGAALPPPAGALPPPMGLGLSPIDVGEVPLDAPLPPAPQIAVKGSPVEESLSLDEKNELLEELK